MHHHDEGASAAAGAMTWFIAMILFLVIGVVLVLALLVWAPWNSGTVNTGTGSTPGIEQQTPGTQQSPGVQPSGR